MVEKNEIGIGWPNSKKIENNPRISNYELKSTHNIEKRSRNYETDAFSQQKTAVCVKLSG